MSALRVERWQNRPQFSRLRPVGAAAVQIRNLERAGRVASPTAAVVESQSVKTTIASARAFLYAASVNVFLCRISRSV